MNSSDWFNQLPDNIIIEIFGQFTSKELLRLTTVCKRWEMLIRDKWLWRIAKFTPDPLEKKQFESIINRYFTNYTKSVDICGKWNGCKTLKMDTYSLSNPVLNLLAEKSPSLTSFRLEEENLNQINLELLPSSLEHLSFIRCDIPPSSFSGCKGKFKELKSLSFKRCPRLTENHLKCFIGSEKLKTIEIYGCYKIDNDAVQVIVKHFKCLKTLSLIGCARCTDSSCFEIARCLNKLEFLDIEEWTGMTEAGRDAILNNMGNLKFFSLKCHQINYGRMKVYGSRLLVT